jgi:hypothetical protein
LVKATVVNVGFYGIDIEYRLLRDGKGVVAVAPRL